MYKTVYVFMVTLFLVLLMHASVTMACADCGSEGHVGVIVVDVQGDFTTWKKGALAVEGADESYVRKVEEATKVLREEGFLIFGTQDWHPGDHISFFTNHDGKDPFEVIEVDGRTQVLWPPHCIQGTENARVLVDNNLFLAIVKKGQDSRYDSYSGFQDDGGAETEMNKILRRNMVRKVVVYGLATDYCVKATAIDAARAGYKVVVIEDLCRGVAPDTSRKAVEEMKEEGVFVIPSMDLQKIKDL